MVFTQWFVRTCIVGLFLFACRIPRRLNRWWLSSRRIIFVTVGETGPEGDPLLTQRGEAQTRACKRVLEFALSRQKPSRIITGKGQRHFQTLKGLGFGKANECIEAVGSAELFAQDKKTGSWWQRLTNGSPVKVSHGAEYERVEQLEKLFARCPDNTLVVGEVFTLVQLGLDRAASMKAEDKEFIAPEFHALKQGAVYSLEHRLWCGGQFSSQEIRLIPSPHPSVQRVLVT